MCSVSFFLSLCSHDEWIECGVVFYWSNTNRFMHYALTKKPTTSFRTQSKWIPPVGQHGYWCDVACPCRRSPSMASGPAWRLRRWIWWSLVWSALPRWRASWVACCACTLTDGTLSMTSGWTASHRTSTLSAGVRSWATAWRGRGSKVSSFFRVSIPCR